MFSLKQGWLLIESFSAGKLMLRAQGFELGGNIELGSWPPPTAIKLDYFDVTTILNGLS